MMAGEADQTLETMKMAQSLIATAQRQSLLPSESKGRVFDSALHMARMTNLAQALAATRDGAWVREAVDRVDWEFQRSFGYLVTLAILELAETDQAVGWKSLVRLFRCYFGPQIDKLMPSIFLAACTNPGRHLPSAQLGECAKIIAALHPGETAFDAASYAGLFDGL